MFFESNFKLIRGQNQPRIEPDVFLCFFFSDDDDDSYFSALWIFGMSFSKKNVSRLLGFLMVQISFD
jgi:hypothetical protein